jgi:co-chaperonin GroES (HSP10)
MQAVNYYIVTEKIKEEPIKIGGLELTEKLNVDNRYSKATVISIGNLVDGVKEGEIIHFDSHAGNGMTWKDKLYHIISIRDVVLIE